MHRTILAAAVLCAATATTALAQQTEIDAELQALEASFHYQQGVITLAGGLATLNVPESFRFLGPEDASRLLVEGWGNPPGEPPLGMLVPSDVSPFSEEGWGVVITFQEDGYVKDDDAASIDYDELLRQMQADTREENEARTEAGYPPVELIGWAEPPHYDQAAHKLYWAKELRFGNAPEHTLNYNIRVLGRRGVLVLNAVSAMSQLPSVRSDMQSVLAFVEFNEGHRYADFVPGMDKVAAYGIAGLIAGKVALKAGFFKVLLAGILAVKKLVVAGVVALGAIIARLFARKKERPA
jgi:uncharacterized membrane-anchored protein